MTRRGLCCLLFGAFGCLLALAADPGPSGIPPEKLKQAETTYQEIFGATHAKLIKSGKLTDKADFAKKLYDRSKESTGDPALQEILRRNALLFVQNDAAGLAIAQEIYRGNSADAARRLHSLEKLIEYQEKAVLLAPVADRTRLATDIVKSYRDLSLEAERAGNMTSALSAIVKGRTLARKFIPITTREVYAALDSDERRVQPLAADQQEADRLKVLIDKNPTDAKSRIGLAVIELRRGRLPQAMEQLNASPNAELSQVAKLLAAMPVDTAAVAAAARKAASSLPADDRKNRFGLLEFARMQYDTLRLSNAANWPALQEEYLSLLEQIVPLEPATMQGKHSMQLILTYLEQAEDLSEKRKVNESLAVLAKARGAMKGLKPTEVKDLVAEIDSLEKFQKGRLLLEANAAKWQSDAKKAPLDAKTNLAYSIALLRLGRLAEAAEPLAACEGKAWQTLGKLLKDLDQAPALALGDAFRLAAGELKLDERADLLGLARDKYEAYLASSPKDMAEVSRVVLLMKEFSLSLPRFGTDKNPALIDFFGDETNTNKLLTEGKGNGKHEVTQFRGHPLISTQGDTVQAVVPAEKPILIVENPTKPGEYRYCGFWIRKEGKGAEFFFAIRRENGSELRYALAPTSRASDASTFQIAGALSDKWIYVQRDLYADFGAPTKVSSVAIVNRDPEGTTWLKHCYFARTAGQVRKAMNLTKPE